MGGDGGSIPGRADIVRTAGMRFARDLGGMGYLPNTQVRAGSEAYKKLEEKQLRWTTCAVTQEPLKPPLVACRLGQLYNKEAMLHRLMQRKTSGVPLPPNAMHIRSLKDLCNLRVEFDAATGRLVCPILKVEFDSGIKGIVLWSCGCVISTKAFEQLAGTKVKGPQDTEKADTTARCPNCDKAYDPATDIVQLVPEISEIPDIKARLLSTQQSKRPKSSSTATTIADGSKEEAEKSFVKKQKTKSQDDQSANSTAIAT